MESDGEGGGRLCLSAQGTKFVMITNGLLCRESPTNKCQILSENGKKRFCFLKSFCQFYNFCKIHTKLCVRFTSFGKVSVFVKCKYA